MTGFAGIAAFAVNFTFCSIGQNMKEYIFIGGLVEHVSGLAVLQQIQSVSAGSNQLLFIACGNLLCVRCFLIILIALVVEGLLERNGTDE